MENKVYTLKQLIFEFVVNQTNIDKWYIYLKDDKAEFCHDAFKEIIPSNFYMDLAYSPCLNCKYLIILARKAGNWNNNTTFCQIIDGNFRKLRWNENG